MNLEQNYSNLQNIVVKDGSITLIKQKTKDHGLFNKITPFSDSLLKTVKDGPQL